MVNLEYFNGFKWVFVSQFHNEFVAWISLGGDDLNYRTINADTDEVLTDKSIKE